MSGARAYTRRRLLAMAGALATPLVLPGKARAQTREFRAADIRGSDYPTVQALGFMDRALRRATNNALRIRAFPDAQLGDEREAFEHLRAGIVDVARIRALSAASIAPELGVLATPFLFRSAAHLHAVADGPIGQRLLEISPAHGFVPLAFLDADAEIIYTRGRAVRTPGDMAGLKLHGETSGPGSLILRALGAVPVPLPLDQVLPALNAGLLDGGVNNMATYVTLDHHVAANFATPLAHVRAPDILAMSEKSWLSLSFDERAAVRAAARAAGLFMRPVMGRWTRLCETQAREQGVTFVADFDEAAFRRALEPAGASLSAEPGAAGIAKEIRDAG